MKKRIFSVFLALTLLITALAGCNKPKDADSAESSGASGGESEQLLSTGYYKVYDEDDEFAGYLRVTSSKIVVYDENGGEKNSLRYDYDADKELYILDEGELFGCVEFTVEKSGSKLTLITDDEDEYTLERIDKSEMPGGDEKDPSGTDAPGYIELPSGCYAGYIEDNIFGYLKVTDSAMTFYYDDGEIEGEARYSYDGDGNCILEMNGQTVTVQFTREQDSYHMINGDDSRLLKPISESEIPVAGSPSVPEAQYIGGNSSVALYAWMPDAMFDDLSIEYEVGGFTARVEYFDSKTGADLMFSALVASGDTLQKIINEAKENYTGVYNSDADLMYNYSRDSIIVSGLGDDFPGEVKEDYVTINERRWRYCEAYSKDDGLDVAMLIWMEGSDMVIVMIGGNVDDSRDYDGMSKIIVDIVFSLSLDA